MDEDARLADELLGPLSTHFAAARAAYGAYLAEGRTLLHASSLRRINQGARALLLAKAHLLPGGLKEDAIRLIGHYDVWLTLWDEHRARTAAELSDEFAFPNEHRYPRESEDRLMAHHEAVRRG